MNNTNDFDFFGFLKNLFFGNFYKNENLGSTQKEINFLHDSHMHAKKTNKFCFAFDF
jgi:hypothetical protein